MKFIVKLDEGEWLAPWGYCLHIDNAKRFKTRSSALRSLAKANLAKDYPNGEIEEVEE